MSIFLKLIYKFKAISIKIQIGFKVKHDKLRPKLCKLDILQPQKTVLKKTMCMVE